MKIPEIGLSRVSLALAIVTEDLLTHFVSIGSGGHCLQTRRSWSSQTFRDKLKVGGEGRLMVVIPAGRFVMSSPLNEPGGLSDE